MASGVLQRRPTLWLCVDSVVQTCALYATVNVTGVSRENESFVVSGLSHHTEYSCWVKDSNTPGVHAWYACPREPDPFRDLTRGLSHDQRVDIRSLRF